MKYKAVLTRILTQEIEIDASSPIDAQQQAEELHSIMSNEFAEREDETEVEPKFEIECQECHDAEGASEEVPYCARDVRDHMEQWLLFTTAADKRMENERNTCQHCKGRAWRCVYVLTNDRIMIICPGCKDKIATIVEHK